MRTTLVLDQGYQPINMVPFTKALSYMWHGKVDVLVDYEVQAHGSAMIPAVVRFNYGISRKKQKVKFSRQNVLVRDKFKCQYCGLQDPTAELTYDHVIPRSQGGTTCWENIVMACVPCNSSKANRTPAQAHMRLLKAPVRPTWIPSFNARLFDVRHVPEEWKDYWTIELDQ